jgi:hypothetical protein
VPTATRAAAPDVQNRPQHTNLGAKTLTYQTLILRAPTSPETPTFTSGFQRSFVFTATLRL